MHPNTTPSIHVSEKSKEIVSFFDSEPAFVLAYKKTEKLASAVYMVTNLFPESEPMRNILRQKISELLSFMILFKTVGEGGKRDFVTNVKTRVLEVSSFLKVSYRGGLISEMNFSVINTEFHNLISILENTQSAPDLAIQNSVKNVFEETARTTNQATFAQNPSVFSVPKTHNPSAFPATVNQSISDTPIKDKTTPSTTDSFRKTGRQETIIGIIKKKKELMIKDIAEVITDCSEKTIQRELNALISSGVLKRTGVRRWSRYSIN